jgi:aldehyde:ferredoxin oxidoreductase
MPYGYAGRLLFVDLTSGAIAEEVPDETLYRTWIGGAGLGARVIMERTKAGIDPLGPGNMLAFLTGPLTATGVYGGGRYTVVTKSPLTGSWVDSSSGGYFGPELKAAGYDAVFFSGAAASPVCLVIDAGKPRLIDAGDLWGKDTYETDDALQEELGDLGSWRIACIGPSGEHGSLLAGIVNEKGRLAARSGVGAVMGSKNLKAVAVRGGKGGRIPVADKEGLKTVQKSFLAGIKASAFHQGLTTAGTGGSTAFLLSIGDCPADNWRASGTEALPGCERLNSGNMDVYKLRPYGCSTCPIRCGALIRIPDGPFASEDELHRPEYETIAALGPLCRNDDPGSVIKATEICNRTGLDTMGVGNAVAFAMECWEKGLIGPKDTGGLELKWGDPHVIVALVRQMAGREGFGALLADGSKAAAERIGKGSEELAMTIGGRAIPYHDPRMAPSEGAFFIADATPAQHMGPQAMAVLENGAPIGDDPLLQPGDPLAFFGDYDKKGDLYARGAAYGQLLCSSGMCALYVQFYSPPIVELLRPVTGWDMDYAEGLETGRRILTLRQAFNAREGVKPKDFKFPRRFQTPLTVGPGAGQQVDFETLRDHYFMAMGWDPESGKPSRRTLERLGIEPGLAGWSG